MTENLRTLKYQQAQNAIDFRITTSPDSSRKDKRRRRKHASSFAAARWPRFAKNSACRTQRLQPIMKRMHQIAERIHDLQRQISRGVAPPFAE